MKKGNRGDTKSPLSFDSLFMDNEKLIRGLVEDKLAEIGGFIVDVAIQPGKVVVLIDKEEGLNIRDCVQVSRHVERTLEEDPNSILNTHGLDVSSPGLDFPFKHIKQYHKNIGRSVNVIVNEGPEITGVLKSVSDEEIQVEEQVKQKGKKAFEKVVKTVPFQNIKETKIVISFK